MENQKINQIHNSNNLITHNIVYTNPSFFQERSLHGRKNGYTRFFRRILK